MVPAYSLHQIGRVHGGRSTYFLRDRTFQDFPLLLIRGSIVIECLVEQLQARLRQDPDLPDETSHTPSGVSTPREPSDVDFVVIVVVVAYKAISVTDVGDQSGAKATLEPFLEDTQFVLAADAGLIVYHLFEPVLDILEERCTSDPGDVRDRWTCLVPINGYAGGSILRLVMSAYEQRP